MSLAIFCSTWLVTSIYFAYDIWATRRRLIAMERSTMESAFPVIRGFLEDAMVHKSHQRIREMFSVPERGAGPHHAYLLDPDKRAVDIGAFGEGRPLRRLAAPLHDPKTHLVMDFPMPAKPACVSCHGSGRNLLGYVRLSTPHGDKARSLSAHIKYHVVALLAILAITGLWVLAIIRNLIQAPLSRVVDAMARVAGGKLNTRIEDASEGELRAIADGFNAMVREIKRDRREILELHRRQVSHIDRLVAVGEIAAELAHEVRNPLTGIGSAVQIIRRECPEDNPRRKVLDKILGELNRMDKTMANFLGYARMPEAVSRPFDVREPLQRAIFLIEPRLRSQAVELARRVPDDLPTLFGDPGQMEQVFLNLALNAVQSMPSGGLLTVAARREADGRVLLEFTDTGVGIPSAHLDKVFKLFFTTREKGSGLGLPVARQIVLSHGGELWIESVPGRGTSVFVRLPDADDWRGKGA